MLDDLMEAELMGHVQAARAALTFLRDVDPAQVVEAGPAQEHWIQQMSVLHLTRVRLAQAAESLHDDLIHFNEQVLAANGSEPLPGWMETWQKEPGQTTVGAAGRKGGRLVKEKYGASFYAQIGKKGGGIVREQRGLEYYRHLGEQGGVAARTKLGSEHFSAIGKKGGTSLAKQRGSEYYRAIGRKGGATPRKWPPTGSGRS